VLRLIYGNDKRNPSRTFDLAYRADGHIYLSSEGFTPNSSPQIELWSGESIRFEGEKKFAESRGNSKLTVNYDLVSGSMMGLFELQRQINQFLLEANLYNVRGIGERVWLEYRWADNLSSLPTPTFGQLSHYYEVFSGNAPQWPGGLHKSGMLASGNIEKAILNLTCSAYPEGLPQQVATAAGAVSDHAKGVLVASGSSSKLHYPAYTSSGLTGQFAVTGWFSLNATWASGNKDIFDYYANASNRIRIIYDASNTRFTITKIVSGTTYTTNSSSFSIANGANVSVILVQDSTTLRLYANGSQIASVTAAATMTDGGTIALGCPATGTIDGVDVILDGWRIFDEAITATQAGSLYAAEYQIKNRGGKVGPPPYSLSPDGDNIVDNYDNGAGTILNYLVLGGIAGDVPSKLTIRFNPLDLGSQIGADKIVYVGIRPSQATFAPADYNFYYYYGLVNTIYAGTQTFSPGTFIVTDVLPGRYKVVASIVTSSGVKLRPFYNLSNTAAGKVYGAYITVGANANYAIMDCGDLFISRHQTPVTSFAYGLETTGTSYGFGLLYLWLIPEPMQISQSATGAWLINATQPAIVDSAAYVFDTSTLSERYHLIKNGDIQLTPGQYNYLFFLAMYDSGLTYVQSSTMQIKTYVTPRYLLPGGMVS